jgi:hypothetical protein
VEPRALADARELGKLLEEVINLALPTPAETIWAKVPKTTASSVALVAHPAFAARVIRWPLLAKRHICKRKGMIPRDLL